MMRRIHLLTRGSVALVIVAAVALIVYGYDLGLHAFR
jgi:preprotein translocase subunit SecE